MAKTEGFRIIVTRPQLKFLEASMEEIIGTDHVELAKMCVMFVGSQDTLLSNVDTKRRKP